MAAVLNGTMADAPNTGVEPGFERYAAMITPSMDDVFFIVAGFLLFVTVQRLLGGKVEKHVKKGDSGGAKPKKAAQNDSVDRAVEAVVDAMEGRGSNVTPELIVTVLRECLRRKDMVIACKVERFAREQQIPTTLDFYEFLLKLYALCGNPRASVLFDEMLGDGFAASEGLLSKLLAQCAESGFSTFADHVHAYLRARSMASVVTYKAVMRVYENCGLSDGICDLYEQAQSDGVRPDSAMCSLLVKFARKCGRKELLSCGLDSSLALLEDASADEMLLNNVLGVCIGSRDMVRLAPVVDRALELKGRLSVNTYGLLIRACSLLQRTSQCRKLWAEMVDSRGICPTEITLSCMLDALVRADALGEAVDIFRTWQSKIPPNVVVYSTLIKGYAAIADAEGAMGMFREMQKAGVQMNTIAYTSLIDAQACGGNMVQAKQLLAQMQQEGCDPCAITFSTLMKGHCRAGDLAKAIDVFNDMKKQRLHFDANIFHTLLDVCVHQSCFDVADWLLATMREQGVVPTSSTLCLVVRMWGKRRQLPEAFAAIRTMPRDYGFPLDTQAGASLISACFFNGAYDRAMDALKMMKESPHGKPDANTYGNMIINFVRRNARAKTNLHQAVELAREACGLPSSQPAKGGFIRADIARRLHHVLRLRGLADELGKPFQEELRAASAALGTAEQARAAACASFLAAFDYVPERAPRAQKQAASLGATPE